MFSARRKQRVKGAAQTLSGEISPYRTGTTSVRSCKYTEGSVNSLEALLAKATDVSFSLNFPTFSGIWPFVLLFFLRAVMRP